MTTIASEPVQRSASRVLALVPNLPVASASITLSGQLPSQSSAGSVIAVAVVATDPVSRLGLSVSLREQPGMRLLPGSADSLPPGTQVAIVAGENIDLAMSDTVRDLRAEHSARVLICAGHLDEHGVRQAVNAGANGVLRRADASAEELCRAVRAVAHGKEWLPDLRDRSGTTPAATHVSEAPAKSFAGSPVEPPVVVPVVVPEFERVRHAGSALTSREATVLRMIADGFDTREIAVSLCYSERTVKNVIHTITTRLMLRNRAHAVAYAVRHQLI